MTRRTALVSGSRSGLGAEVSYRLEAEGYYVIGIDRAYPRGIQATHVRSTFGVDVRELSHRQNDLRRLLTSDDELLVIVNAAGIGGHPGTVWELEIADQVEVVETNAIGCLSICAALSDRLSPSATVINIAGFAGVAPYSDWAAYSMSKSAVLSLSSSLRVQLSGRGVRVTAMIPGPVATPLQFEHTPWHTLLHPDTVVDAMMFVLKQRPGVCIEELRISPLHVGEVPVSDGPVSRMWPAED